MTTVVLSSESALTVVLSEANHRHDDRYYTETEVDALIDGITGSYDASFSTDHSYSGPTSSDTVGEAVVFGDFLYKNMVDGKWYKARANAETTVPCRRMALADALADSTCLMLHPGGSVRDDSWDWTDDGTVVELWLSASVAGDATESLDTASGAFGQVVATPLASNIIEFCASLPVARF